MNVVIEEMRNKNRHAQTNSNMRKLSSSLTVITFNITRLNYLIKRQNLEEWVKKWSNDILSARDSLYIQRHTQV